MRAQLILCSFVLLLALMIFSCLNCRQRSAEMARQISFGEIAEMVPVYSPDGKWLVFEYFYRVGNGFPQIWIMPTDMGFTMARPLVVDKNSNAEFTWSPDNKWVAYIKEVISEAEQKAFIERGESSTQIWKVNIESGANMQVSRFPVGFEFGDKLSWSLNDQYLAFEHDFDIYAIAPDGGEAYKLVDIDTSGLSMSNVSWLSLSPDGDKFLFISSDHYNEDVSHIWIVDNKERSKPRQITDGPGEMLASWSRNSEFIVFSQSIEDTLSINIFAISLDSPAKLTRITTRGSIDFAPNWRPDANFIAFCRNMNYKEETTGSTIWEDFHLWEIEIPSDLRKLVNKNRIAEY